MKRTFREFDGKQTQNRDGSIRVEAAVFFGDGLFEEWLLKELNQVVSGVSQEFICAGLPMWRAATDPG